MSDRLQTPFRLALEACTAGFSDLLPVHGFGRDWVGHHRGAYRRHWTHDAQWKRNTVEIVYRRGGEQRILVNLFILLPIPGDAGAFTSLGGRGLSTPRIPRLLAKYRVRRNASRVAALVEAELAWFEETASPQACLRYLAAENPGFLSTDTGQQTQAYLTKL